MTAFQFAGIGLVREIFKIVIGNLTHKVFTRGYSSVVEHSTADREVPGSNPGVPSAFFLTQ